MSSWLKAAEAVDVDEARKLKIPEMAWRFAVRTVLRGKNMLVVGPSGCGKTTLLNIVSGLDNDYDGDILVEQQHTHPKIGYIFSSFL